MNITIKDFSDRVIKKGDVVFILNSIDMFNRIAQNMNGIEIGEVVDFINKNAIVKYQNELKTYLGSELSKINLNDIVDDVIIHIAQDIENWQLLKETVVLNSMLDPDCF